MKRYIAVFPAALLVALPLLTSAHEHQSFEINGVEYEFTVGSLNEPISVDDKTGVDLRISKSGSAHAHEDDHDGMPVAGLEETLKVEMIAGDKKKVTDLSPVFNTPGAYKNAFYATVATTISYRIFGDLEGTPIDLTFTCNPVGHASAEEDTSRVQMGDNVFRTHKSGSFGCPSDKATLGFPEESASVVDLQGSDASTKTMALGSGALTLAALAVAFMRRRT